MGIVEYGTAKPIQGRIQTVATVAYATVRFSLRYIFPGCTFFKVIKN
jgi:hypothetical protein